MPKHYKKKSKSSWKRYASSSYDVASKALKTALMVKKLINVEFKKHDDLNEGTVSSTGSVHDFTEIAQGDAKNERVGNSLKTRNMTLRGQLRHNSAGDQVQNLRLILVRDTQTVADGAPGFSDVVDDTGNVFSYLNADTVGRFDILHTLVLTVTDQNPSRTFKWNSGKQFHVRYNGSASTDIQRNGIYLLVYSDKATNTPTLQTAWRMSYIDN